jgi:hypothetical protein
MSEGKKKDYSGFLSWGNLKDIASICLILIVTWKLLSSDISISIKEIAFSDLLSIVVAFFAIALSVAFYFKATETSNRFYDNSYKFTKEISEILGRIEAGFGEKLKHIDEGYSGIRDKFDQLPFDAATADKEVEAEKEEIEKKQKEQEDLLENLAQRAKLAESEKEEVFMKMAKTSKELDIAKNDLRRMQRNIVEHKASNSSPEVRRRVIGYLVGKFREELPSGIEVSISPSLTREIFSNIKDDIHSEAIDDLVNSGYMNNDGELSREAINIIRIKLREPDHSA